MDYADIKYVEFLLIQLEDDIADLKISLREASHLEFKKRWRGIISKILEIHKAIENLAHT